MRILHLIPALSGGGAERQLSYLAPELTRLGHEVHIAFSEEGPLKPEFPGVVLHKLKSRSNYDPHLLWQLIHIIRDTKPDIVHTWIVQMDILGSFAAGLTGIPWIVREPSSAVGYPQTWKNRLRVWAVSSASAVVSNSLGGDGYWKCRLPNSRRYVIRNGIPVDIIEKCAAALPSGFPVSKRPIILYVGRLTSEKSADKNLGSFLKALSIVKKRHEIIGVLCGEGPQRAELEHMRHELGLDGDVHFLGHLPPASVWSLMKSASVFVSLSAYEGCPNTVMEAMACGCSLVVSNIPAHREILDESCASMVGLADIEQTANAILQALLDRDTTSEPMLITQQKARKWSIREMACNYESVYKELV